MAKIAYRTGTVEHHLGLPRESAWEVLLAVLDDTPVADRLGAGCQEDVLSLEPPWRRVSHLAGGLAGTERCEVSFTGRDDGDECHLTWSYLVHPGPGDDDLVAALDHIGHEILDRVSASAAAAG